ncbi:MAG: four helix bundle protein [Sedimentisphaerales bacterium]|nr:four helix bundle protein [Sedimentisphaerales bacterium]
MENKKPIRSFHDLEVYQTAYQAMLEVFEYLLPKLPVEEKYDLTAQLRRSTKAIPRLIAEGHSKRHQKKGFQRYLDDTMAESNETIVSLTQAKDLYPSMVDVDRCERLIDTYDKISRQCYNLALAWGKFTQRGRLPITDNELPNRQTKRASQPINDNL